MTIHRWTGLAVLAALAMVLMAAGPSVGDRIAAGQLASPPVTAVPCRDDSAMLVGTGEAQGVLFRCAGGVPVPREGPWSTDGCDWDYRPEATLLATTGNAWEPDTACLITTLVEVVPAATPATRTSGW